MMKGREGGREVHLRNGIQNRESRESEKRPESTAGSKAILDPIRATRDNEESQPDELGCSENSHMLRIGRRIGI